MKKTLLSVLSILLVLSMILSACGSPAAPSAAAPVGDAPASDAPATDAPAASPSTIEEGAKLVYWTMWNEAEPQGMVIAEAVEAFTAKTGVEVEVNFNGRDIRQTLEPALAGGETIDLFDEDIERVLNSWGDYLLPLDNYVAASYDGKVYRDVVSKTMIDLAEKLGANAQKEDASGNMVPRYTDGSKIHNIPYQPSTFVVMYNKDLFDKAGITAVPKTWAEFTAACEKLKAADITPITVDNAYMGAFFGYNMDRLIGSEKTLAMVKNMDFTDPGVLKFAQIWEDFIKKGYMSKNAATNIYPDGQNKEIAKGTTAMYLNGTWLPNEIKSSGEAGNPIRWGSFAWPAMEGGDGVETNNYGSQSFGINKNTKYPNAAFELVRWLTIGEWDQKLADTSMGVPMANDATWPVELAEAKAVLDGSTNRIPWACGMEDVTEVNAQIMESFSKLVSGTINAQGFADAMAGVKKSN